MKNIVSIFCATVLLGGSVFFVHGADAPAAAEFKPFLKQIDLQDGDTLVFLGDSITHQCLYTQYIEDFYYTRYPKRHIHFYNSGVGGDTAANALARFDEDVAKFKPKYVTILLGMNDGGYTNFNANIFANYERDMTKLLDRLGELGTKAVPMTPTMHDARAARMGKNKASEPRDTFYNGVLAYYGSWLREQASVRDLGFVDMYSPLNNLTIEQRKKDPKFTMIPDAVHPGAAGQVVMAAAILNDMVPRAQVGAITIARQTDGKWRQTAVNGKVTELNAGEDQVSFDFLAESLPWVLPPEAADGYKLTASGHRHSNEKLTVSDLKAGKYELRIDGQAMGAYTQDQLARGVELEGNEKTPQYQQALKVALLNKDKNDKAMRPLRNLWRDLKVKTSDVNRTAQAPDKKEEAAAKRAALAQWKEGDFKSGIAKFQEQLKQYEEQIYQANQPVRHKYEVSRAP